MVMTYLPLVTISETFLYSSNLFYQPGMIFKIITDFQKRLSSVLSTESIDRVKRPFLKFNGKYSKFNMTENVWISNKDKKNLKI